MTDPENPYGTYLEGRDPVALMSQTPDRIRALVDGWSADRFQQRYAPGKWNAAQIVLHLAQVELAIGNRIRMALSTPDYVVQPFDQDAWVRFEPVGDPGMALQAYHALRQLNVACACHLSPEQRAKHFAHPERGAISVNWLLVLLAGHDIHHMRQLEQI